MNTTEIIYEASIDGETWFEWDIRERCPYPYLRKKVPPVEDSFGRIGTGTEDEPISYWSCSPWRPSGS
jgi:hypothetical protein